jgi:6-phosphogluconolactonase (cycloisomerase 2 family)
MSNLLGGGFHRLRCATLRVRMSPAAVGAAILIAGSLLASNAHAARRWGVDSGGVVYTMTNAETGNEILVYRRNRGGRLNPVNGATTPTGGAGASMNAPVDPLGSQNALVYDSELNMLFAVNAGDDTVTAFDTGPSGVTLRRSAHESSGGYIPVSLAVSENRLYVLNAGGSGSVATFEIDEQGELTLIGTLDLGISPGYETEPPFDRVNAPGQVGVDALARNLIVTHGGGQELLVAELNDDGVPMAASLFSAPTPNLVPFAFEVTRYGSTLLAEASGYVTAFDPPAGGLLPVTASVGTAQAATCWIVISDNGFAYVSNTGDDTLSQFAYTRTGMLTLVDQIAAVPGDAPIDMTLANDGGFLYSLDAGSGQISGFVVDAVSGELAHVETQGGLPAMAGLQGIAARDF